MDHVVLVHAGEQKTALNAPRKGQGLDMGMSPEAKLLSEAGSVLDDDVTAKALRSEQFFLKMGSLVSLLGTCTNTASNMLNAYHQDQWQMALTHAILLGVLQLPTTLAVFYNFLKNWIKSKLTAYRKAMRDLKMMEEMYEAALQVKETPGHITLSGKSLDLQQAQGHHDMQAESLRDPSIGDALLSSSHSSEPIKIHSLGNSINVKPHSDIKEGLLSKPSHKYNKGVKSAKKAEKHKHNSKKTGKSRSKSPNFNIQTSLSDTDKSKPVPPIRRKSRNTCMCCRAITCFPCACRTKRSLSVPDVSQPDKSLTEFDANHFELNDDFSGGLQHDANANSHKLPKRKLTSRNSCTCCRAITCFPCACRTKRSLSVPDVSQPDKSLTEYDANHLELNDNFSIGLQHGVNANSRKLPKRKLKFPWKRRPDVRLLGITNKRKPRTLLELATESQQRTEDDINLDTTNVKQKKVGLSHKPKARCLPMFCHRRGISTISDSDDVNLQIENETEPVTDKRRRRLPETQGNIPSGINENTALKAATVVSEMNHDNKSLQSPSRPPTERRNIVDPSNPHRGYQSTQTPISLETRNSLDQIQNNPKANQGTHLLSHKKKPRLKGK